MITTNNRRAGRLVVRAVAGALVAGGALALGVPSAQAAPLSVTFDKPVAHASWQVPSGVTQVSVSAYGGQGSSGDLELGTYGRGGRGASAHAVFAVTPGQVLDLTVAGAGFATEGGIGGGGAGGAGSLPGGGGGGASVVSADGVPWLVAGGGGGGASYAVAGGDSGHAGAVFEEGFRPQDGRGGGGANGTRPGAGGAAGSSDPSRADCTLLNPGAPGAPGASFADGVVTGGRGGGRWDTLARIGGGGGGGGYAGGGGGGGGAYCVDAGEGTGSGGGGGGGSSYLAPTAIDGVVDQGVRAGDGAITITYVDPDGPVDAPTVSPAANAAGWHNTAVRVDWHWTDAMSGVNAAMCAPHTYSGDRTGDVELVGTCSDLAGNVTSDSVDVRIDPAKPTAAPRRTGDFVHGWSRGPVVVDWNWADALSGIDRAACPRTSTVRSEGVHAVASTCADVAGNDALASTTVRIDRTAPKIVVRSPLATTYHQGQHVLVRYRCKDSGVGPATCTGTVAHRHALPTDRVGRHVVTFTATDLLGNDRTVHVVYRVRR